MFIDIRDGQRYKAVRMPDNKRWMAENVNYKTLNGSVCYGSLNDQANCSDGYGRLYSGNVMTQACPPGWSLPTDDDWTLMLDSVEKLEGGVANHGTKGVSNGTKAAAALKANVSGQNGIDSYGFSVLFAGYCDATVCSNR